MNRREGPIFLSFPAGTWLDTQIRVSFFIPLVIVGLMLRFGDVQLGLVVGAILLLSVLLHEFGHIFAARLTGGYGDEILLWPLGGLAFTVPGSSVRSRILIPLAGPLVNLAICLATAIPAWQSGQLGRVLNPFLLSSIEIPSAWGEFICLMVFTVNWLQFLINLMPVYPLDGGQILKTILDERYGSESSTITYLMVGTIIGFLFLIGGWLFDNSTIVFIGAVVCLLNLQETFQLRVGEHYDEKFLGAYDFSQGYTSLERSENDEPASTGGPTKAGGMLQRWKQRRADEKLRRQQEQTAEEERELDRILAKLHETGQDSLTEKERRLLKQASSRFRNRDGKSS